MRAGRPFPGTGLISWPGSIPGGRESRSRLWLSIIFQLIKHLQIHWLLMIERELQGIFEVKRHIITQIERINKPGPARMWVPRAVFVISTPPVHQVSLHIRLWRLDGLLVLSKEIAKVHSNPSSSRGLPGPSREAPADFNPYPC